MWRASRGHAQAHSNARALISSRHLCACVARSAAGARAFGTGGATTRGSLTHGEMST